MSVTSQERKPVPLSVAYSDEVISSEDTVPPPTPPELFASHVAAILEDGDSIDARSFFEESGSSVLKIASAGVLLGQMYSASGYADLHTVINPLVATTGATLASVSLWKHSRRNARADERISEKTLEAVREQYELYRVKDSATGIHEVVMRWYGSMDVMGDDGEIIPARNAPEALAYVARLARDNEIRTVFIESGLLEGSAGDVRGHSVEVDTAEWLRRKKDLNVSMKHQDGSKAEHKLLAFTPEKLEVVSHTMGYRSVEKDSLAKAIELLEDRRAQHPLVGIFKDYKLDDGPAGLLSTKLEATARKGIEQKLTDFGVKRGWETADIPVQRSEKTVMTGLLAGNVMWQADGKTESVVSLPTALGTTHEDLMHALNFPDAHTTPEIVTAVEYAAYQFARDQLRQSASAEEPPVIEPDPLLQVAIKAPTMVRNHLIKGEDGPTGIYTNRFRRRSAQLLLAAACFTAVGGESFWVDHIAADIKKAATQHVETEMAKQLGIQIDDLNQAQKDRAEVFAHNSFITPVRTFFDARAAEQNLMKKSEQILLPNGPRIHIGHGKKVFGLGDSQTSLENTEGGTSLDEVIWKLEPVGNVSTKGYWAENIANTMTPQGVWEYQHAEGDVTHAYTDFPVRPSDGVNDYIKTTHSFDGFPAKDEPSLHPADGFPMIHIPVREGMMPIAGEIDGRPVQFLFNSNGTYGIAPEKDQVDSVNDMKLLTYYIAEKASLPDDYFASRRILSEPRATAINSLGQREGDRPAIQEVWSQRRATMPGSDRDIITADINYSRKNFSDSLTPLDQDPAKLVNGLPGGWQEFTKHQMEIGTEDCKVAGTLLAFDNPQLNVATGIRNNADNVLKAGEGHLWTVGADAMIYDATPYLQDAAAGASSDKLDASSLALWGIEGTIGAIGIGMIQVGWKRRDELKKAAAQMRLNRYRSVELFLAKQIADDISYAEYPKLDIERMARRAQDVDAEAALDDLGRQQVHSAYVRDSLESALNPTQDPDSKLPILDDDQRQMLRGSQRIIKLMQQAGWARTVKSRADISGLL